MRVNPRMMKRRRTWVIDRTVGLPSVSSPCRPSFRGLDDDLALSCFRIFLFFSATFPASSPGVFTAASGSKSVSGLSKAMTFKGREGRLKFFYTLLKSTLRHLIKLPAERSGRGRREARQENSGAHHHISPEKVRGVGKMEQEEKVAALKENEKREKPSL